MTIVLGIVGLAVGSFLNVAIDRLPLGQSLVRVSSHCAVCHSKLKPWDLVPVLSYLSLRGRCRYCRYRIPLKLPLVETFTGATFAYIGHEYGISLGTALLMAYSGFLIVIFMIDLERQLILNKVILPATILALAASAYRPTFVSDGILEIFWRSLAGGGIALGIMLAIYLIFLPWGGLGEGDVKVAPFLGLITGFPIVFVALMLAFIGGGLVAIILLVAGLKGRKEAMPFGPALALATLISLFWGHDLWDWYTGLFQTA